MTPERWQIVYTLYEEALDIPAEKREIWLRERTAEDPAALQEVLRLLRLSDSAEEFLEVSASTLLGFRQPGQDVFEPEEIVARRYRILRLIGKGGMGEVFAAFDMELNVEVALKTVPFRYLDDASAQSNLRREALLAREVTHRNVCRIFDLFVHSPEGKFGEVAVLAMELVEGATLREYIVSSAPLSNAKAAEIASQLCAGLAAAHDRGIIHRDLKPANVLLVDGAAELRPVITDFGLSRRQSPVDGANSERSLGGLLGTPEYMAPELLSGARASVASDIYALGVMLYEMVTGEKPYPAVNSLEELLRRFETPAPSARKRNPVLPKSWDATIRICLSRDPVRRPKDARQVDAMLRGDVRVESPLTRRNILLAAVGAGAASAAGFGLWHAKSTRVALFPVENLSGDPAQSFFCGGLWSELVRQLHAVDGIHILPHPAPRPASLSHFPAPYALAGSLQPDRSVLLSLTDVAAGSVAWTERLPARAGHTAEMHGQAYAAALRGLSQIRPMRAKLAGIFVPGVAAATPVTTSEEALQQYSRGVHLLRSRNLQDTNDAISSLQAALRLDPRFALAYAALAEAQIGLIETSVRSNAELLLTGHGYADRAVREGPQFPETHLILGAFRQMAWDWDGARASYGEVFRLSPDLGRGHAWYSGLLLQFGTGPEVLAASRRGFDLDPFDQIIRNSYSIVQFFCGQYDEAIRVHEETLRTSNSLIGRQQIGNVHAYQGFLTTGWTRAEHFRLAMEQAQAVKAAEDSSPRIPEEGMRGSDRMYSLFYSLAGDAAAARPYLDRLEANMSDGRVSPAMIARAYAALGDHEKAMDLIKLSLDRKDRVLMYIRTNPFFKVLQSNPRYLAVLQTMQL